MARRRPRQLVDTYSVQAINVCDDIRHEITGKMVLIGVYNGVAIVREMPTAFPKLVFNIVVVTRSSFDKANFEIWEKNKRRIEQSLQIPSRDLERMVLNYEIRGAKFDDDTKLSVRFALDGEPFEIATFEVRKAATDEETAKLKLLA